MKVLKYFAPILLFSLFAANLSAYDVGGAIKSTSEGDLFPEDFDTSSFTQYEQADLWFSLNFSKLSSFYAKGFGKISIPTDSDVSFSGNLESFMFSTVIEDLFGPLSAESIKIGRFRFADSTGIVQNHILDGISAQTILKDFQFTLEAATSILQFKDQSTIALSQADQLDLADDTILLAPPRLFMNLKFQFPQIFLNQSLKLAALSQIDLRPGLLNAGDTITSENQLGGSNNTVYTGIDFGGPFASILYYNIYGYLGLGKAVVSTSNYAVGTSLEEKTMVSGLGGINISLYLKEALNSRIALSSMLSSWDSDASGSAETDTDGLYTSFYGLNTYEPNLIFNPGLGNIWKSSLEYSIKPAKFLQIAVKENIFVRPYAGAIGDGSVSLTTNSSDLFLGSETALNINSRLTSDLGISLDGAIFIPNDALIDSGIEVLLKAQVNLSL